LTPGSWTKLGFWEDYFDGEGYARDLFEKEIRDIVAFD